MSMLVALLIKLMFVCVAVFLCAAVILWLFPKDKILAVKGVGKSYRGTIPPRGALNDFGRLAHTVLCVSGTLVTVFFLVLAAIELWFLYGGGVK